MVEQASQFLKQFREKTGLDYNDIHELTGVPVRFLVSLHAGRVNDTEYFLENESGRILKASEYLDKFRSFMNDIENNQLKENSTTSNKLLNDIEELKKEKIKNNLRKNEYNRSVRKTAKTELLLEEIKDSISKVILKEFTPYKPKNIKSSISLIAIHSDWHGGQKFDNIYGKYNLDICQERANRYMNEVFKYQNLYNARNLYVPILGDMISGDIHDGLRRTNEITAPEQVSFMTKLLAKILINYGKEFERVEVIDVPGNHSRTGEKENVLNNERLDITVIDNINFAFNIAGIQNIDFIRSPEGTINSFIIGDKKYIIAHGDYDNNDNKIKQLINFVNAVSAKNVDIVLLGHFHTFEYKVINGTEVIRGGGLAGTGDEFTNQKRIYGRASQVIVAIDDSTGEIIGIHPVYLD